jgi:hypothetical protein
MTEAIEIPPMSEPMGKYWRQPRLAEIAVDEIHAVMSSAAFDQLQSYSFADPTVVYAGKMWKRRNESEQESFWELCWYGPECDGNESNLRCPICRYDLEGDRYIICSINRRKIIIA